MPKKEMLFDPDEFDNKEKLEQQKDVEGKIREESEKAAQTRDKLLKKFDISKIRDFAYLQDIFDNDSASLSYLNKIYQQMLDSGYEDSPTLSEYLFLSVISRRLQINYQQTHIETETEDIPLLKEIERISEKKAIVQKTLDEQREKRAEKLDVVGLHEEMIKRAKATIKSNIGEHTFRCEQCKAIVNAQGLPHWAIETSTRQDGEKIYHVFSSELWSLVKENKIPIHYMSFSLRTSVEGLLETAKARGEKNIPTFKLVEEEKELKKLLLDAEDV